MAVFRVLRNGMKWADRDTNIMEQQAYMEMMESREPNAVWAFRYAGQSPVRLAEVGDKHTCPTCGATFKGTHCPACGDYPRLTKFYQEDQQRQEVGRC